MLWRKHEMLKLRGKVSWRKVLGRDFDFSPCVYMTLCAYNHGSLWPCVLMTLCVYDLVCLWPLTLVDLPSVVVSDVSRDVPTVVYPGMPSGSLVQPCRSSRLGFITTLGMVNTMAAQNTGTFWPHILVASQSWEFPQLKFLKISFVYKFFKS